jgi:hypothetical protein
VAFTVETGAGLTNSNSYISVADADAYFVERGDATWPGSLTNLQKETALVRATSFIDAKYRMRFKGQKGTYEQALAWPRLGATIDGDGMGGIWFEGFGTTLDGYAIPSDEIPIILKYATCELAKRALNNELAPDIKPGAQNVISKKVGPIEIKYSDGQYVPYTLWQYATLLLKPLLEGSSLNVNLLRS